MTKCTGYTEFNAREINVNQRAPGKPSAAEARERWAGAPRFEFHSAGVACWVYASQVRLAKLSLARNLGVS
jgi:hypothetical protein